MKKIIDAAAVRQTHVLAWRLKLSAQNECRLNMVTSACNNFTVDPAASSLWSYNQKQGCENYTPPVVCIPAPSVVHWSVSQARGVRSSEPSVILWNKRVVGQSHLSSFWWSLCHLTQCPPEASSDSRLQRASKQSDHLEHHTDRREVTQASWTLLSLFRTYPNTRKTQAALQSDKDKIYES